MNEQRMYICSPYRNPEPRKQERNRLRAIQYGEQLARFWYQTFGESVVPVIPHASLTLWLDDANPAEREIGLRMGMELLSVCDALVVCGSTISEGMANEIAFARERQMDIYCTDATLAQELGVICCRMSEWAV